MFLRELRARGVCPVFLAPRHAHSKLASRERPGHQQDASGQSALEMFEIASKKMWDGAEIPASALPAGGGQGRAVLRLAGIEMGQKGEKHQLH